MIFYLASIVFLATVSAIPSGRVEVVFPSMETSRSGVKTIKFTALDQDVELKLISAGDILGKNFTIEDVNGQIKHSVDVENLRRKIYRDSANGAALLIDEDGPATIEGIINSNLRIKPHQSGRIIKDGVIAHQIVELIDDKKSYKHDDYVMPEDVKTETENVARMAREGECIVVEYYVVTESRFTQRFDSDQAVTNYVTVTFTEVQNKIDTMNLGIKVRLLGVTPYHKESEPSFINDSLLSGHQEYVDARKIVHNMKVYFCKHKTGLAKSADIIMLLITRTLGVVEKNSTTVSEIAGSSSISSVCKRCNNVGICIDNSDYNERADTVAHESAHLLGSPHDGEGPDDDLDVPGSPGAANCPDSDGYIMGTRNDKNGKKFSECTKQCVKYLLSLPRASCVYEKCSK